MDTYICHVCGYPELNEPPWGINGESSSFNICPCCGFEYGYDDCQLEAYEKNKQKWINSGAKWFDEDIKPGGWSIDTQLKNIKMIPQHLLPNHLKIGGGITQITS
ncbi:hypothetical protein [Paenibacillus sp. URB8-2]|uniref:hypothetical protein n=1 Tax=Paenibacillus sp. URB8-2 TaxID=2741301 RepID=UPI0015BF4659|nr:hypothetical protein [Paenibacillus sp. URB8-2]BCG59454.1 hypothetical protein PUR_28790 [Paenibacillus sp. URB8-2]